MESAAVDELPAPIGRGTPAFRRVILALVAAGFSTFALLYCTQSLLPVFSQTFRQSPAVSSLSVSISTGALGGALLFSGVVAERIERRRMMVFSTVAAGLLTVAVALAPSWPLLLVARALTGLVLSGVPAVALTYIGEEIDPSAIGIAVGLHIGGNTFGGMCGRLVTGIIADQFGWRVAVASMGVLGLISAGLLRLYLPPSRRFVAGRPSVVGALINLGKPFRDKGLPWLFLEAFLYMGAFVSVYNYIGFRLLGPPYHLSQTAVGFIFTLYLIGIFSSAWVGDLAGRLGRRKVFWATTALMAAGVALTTAAPLALVILGVAMLTFGFFGCHSIASSWVGRRAGPVRAQAASMFLFFYYLGGSVMGSISGLAFGAHGWPGVAVMLEAELALALAVAIGLAFLKPLPGNEPIGAQNVSS